MTLSQLSLLRPGQPVYATIRGVYGRAYVCGTRGLDVLLRTVKRGKAARNYCFVDLEPKPITRSVSV